jgi:hypothetical protein
MHMHVLERRRLLGDDRLLRALVLLPGSACQPPAALIIRVRAINQSEDRGSVFNSVCSCAGSLVV